MTREFPGNCGNWRPRQRDGIAREEVREDLCDLLEGAERKGKPQQMVCSSAGAETGGLVLKERSRV